jgi:putative phage-type endonuclease
MLTEQQRKDRNKGIGGSDIAVILGLSNYKTAYQLYLEKKGLIEIEETESQYQYWGSTLEPVIRAEFEKRNLVSIETGMDTKQHPLYPFLRGNLDGWIETSLSVWEAKICSAFMRDKWGEPGTAQIPPEYLVQVAFYCAIVNSADAHISVLIGGNDYREYRYDRDLELEAKIISAACKFWNAVQTDIPPEPVNIDDLKLMWPNSDSEKSKAVNLEILEHVTNLVNIKSKIKELEEFETDARFNIMRYMEDVEVLTSAEGTPLATLKTNKKGVRTLILKGNNNS